MKTKTDNKRRQFLRNISLTTLGIGVLPILGAGKSPSSGIADDIAACDPTTLDLYGEGPFYTANAPVIQNDQLAGPNEPGGRLTVSGRVYNQDCTEAIPDTEIDVWHCDDAGIYDNVGYQLRGKTLSNAQGFYLFETIKPGKYLNGNSFRPSHIHFKITTPGYPTMTTQLYFQGDTDIPGDAAASVTSGQFDATKRIVPIVLTQNGVFQANWDIVVDGDGIGTGIQDLHIENGMIYEAGPNPFTDALTIRYGVFKPSKVGLMVYDIQGRLVANLEEKNLNPEKYTATWHPEAGLPSGHYFIALKINELQVHYLKVLKQ